MKLGITLRFDVENLESLKKDIVDIIKKECENEEEIEDNFFELRTDNNLLYISFSNENFDNITKEDVRDFVECYPEYIVSQLSNGDVDLFQVDKYSLLNEFFLED